MPSNIRTPRTLVNIPPVPLPQPWQEEGLDEEDMSDEGEEEVEDALVQDQEKRDSEQVDELNEEIDAESVVLDVDRDFFLSTQDINLGRFAITKVHLYVSSSYIHHLTACRSLRLQKRSSTALWYEESLRNSALSSTSSLKS